MPNVPSFKTYSHPHQKLSSNYSTVYLLKNRQKRITYYQMLEYFYNFLETCQDKNLYHYLIEVLERNDYREMLNAYDRLLDTYERKPALHNNSLIRSQSQFNSLIGITFIALMMLITWFLLRQLESPSSSPLNMPLQTTQYNTSEPTLSPNTLSTSATIEPQYYHDFQNHYTGTIGEKLHIEMYLRSHQGHIVGYYYYQKYKENIRLEGEIDIYGNIKMYGYDKKDGHVDIFDGVLTDKNRIYGTWINPIPELSKSPRNLPFTLEEK